MTTIGSSRSLRHRTHSETEIHHENFLKKLAKSNQKWKFNESQNESKKFHCGLKAAAVG